MSSRAPRLLLVAVASLCPAVASSAVLKGAAPGRLLDAPDGSSRMEQLSIDTAVAPALLGVALEGSVRIEDWPVAPGVRRTVVVTRHDVYAPDAKIVAIDGGKEVEIPRSKLVFLWGTAEGDGATSVLITVNPDTAGVSGSSSTPDGSFDLLAPSAERSGHLLTRSGALYAQEQGKGFQCGFDRLPKDKARAALLAERQRTLVPQALTTLHTAVIAVDTDNEFMLTDFANNPTNAANYIAQLFAGLTAMYERDVFVRLLQGYTILRLSTTSDPYVQPGAAGNPPSVAQINEVGDYWSANYTGVKRAVVMMLSGKTGGGGIAYVGVLCNGGRFGTSFSYVSPNGTSPSSSDLQVIGHELGHNFGAAHTQCTDTNAAASGTQPVDFCFTICSFPGQTNCDTCNGAPPWSPNPGTSCPAAFSIDPANGAPVNNVRGTLMSYCHLLGGCGVTNIFHPQSITLGVGPDLDAAVNQCVFPVVGNPAPTVTGINPASGPASGGSTVTLTGTNFRTPASVAFADLGGGKAATGVMVTSPTSITVTTPAHTAGLKDVVVMNPDQQTGTLRNGFTYVPAVLVTAIAPNGGSTVGGTPVTITGSAFAAPATVTLGGVSATAVNVVSSTSITATSPPHAAGIVTVGVQSAGQSPTLPNGYFYIAPTPPGRLFTLAPCRLVDTRNPNGALGGPALVASGRRDFTLTNTCGVPPTAKAISVNLTVTGATAPGFVSLFPGDGIAPATSNINFATGQTRANNAVVLLATNGNGKLAVLNGAGGTVHFILDVNGYFQ